MPIIKLIELQFLKKILKVWAIYGYGGYLGHVTETVFINTCLPSHGGGYIKFGFDWQSGFVLCLFAILVITYFGFEGGTFVLNASVPGHCLPFTF